MKLLYLFGVLIWPIVVVQSAPRESQLAMMIVLGSLVMGFIVAAWSWIAGIRFGDFSWTVLCVSLSLLIAWLGLLVPTEFGFGSAEDASGKLIVGGILSLSIMVGIAYGSVTWRLRHPAEVDTASTPETPFTRDANQRSLAASEAIQTSPPGLFWFTVGLLLAIGVTFLAAWVSYDFVDRGPVTMRTTWGGEIHAYDKTVDAVTGFLIAVIGWVVGLAGLRYHFPRPLTIGIILGATLLGIIFASPGR